MKSFILLDVVSTLLCANAGCGGANMPALGEVSGTVTKGGQPVEGLSLEFVPTDGGRPSMALTDAEGKYTMRYLADVDGALVGSHTVRYQNFGPQPATGAGPDAMVIPEADPGKLDTKGDELVPAQVVVEEGSNELDFEFIAAS